MPSVQIPDQDHRWLSERCKITGQTRASVIHAALRIYARLAYAKTGMGQKDRKVIIESVDGDRVELSMAVLPPEKEVRRG